MRLLDDVVCSDGLRIIEKSGRECRQHMAKNIRSWKRMTDLQDSFLAAGG